MYNKSWSMISGVWSSYHHSYLLQKQEQENLLYLKRLQAQVGMSDERFNEIYEQHGFEMTEKSLLIINNPVVVPYEKAQEVFDSVTPPKFLSCAQSEEMTEFQKALRRDIFQSLKIPMSGWKSDEET